jgi:hypothetical protein
MARFTGEELLNAQSRNILKVNIQKPIREGQSLNQSIVGWGGLLFRL